MRSDILTIVDSIIILFLLCGAVLGFKKGAIKSLVALIGTIILVVVSYYLKNPVAEVLFRYGPFLNFKGAWEGLPTLNILLYESVAYILVFVVLSSVLSLFLKISGVIEKILNATIILGIPSKLIGMVLGFLEALVFTFIVLFVMLQFNVSNPWVRSSKVGMKLLDKTPFIGPMVKDTYKAIEDITKLEDKYKNSDNKDMYNCEILNIMLDYEVITPEMAEELVNEGKLPFKGAMSIINSYKEDAHG